MESVKTDLKSVIQKKFRTQREFARKLNIDESIVSNYINGVRGISDEDKALWAETLDLEVLPK